MSRRNIVVLLAVATFIGAGCQNGGTETSDTTPRNMDVSPDGDTRDDEDSEGADAASDVRGSDVADGANDTAEDVLDETSDSDANHDTAGEVGRDAKPNPLRVLVFTKTEGYRHGSIGDGVDAIRRLAADRDWEVTKTEDGGTFQANTLSEYDVVVWLNTTGDVLDGSQQTAFRQWVEGGGGYVGVHAAADTEYQWDWYGTLMGAWFDSHPNVQEADIDVEDRSHPATDHLGSTWTHRDEWYNYQSNPRQDVQVLMAVDESSYNGGNMGSDHPIAWYHEVSEGRAFYTGLGHTSATYEESDFERHLRDAIEWAAGR